MNHFLGLRPDEPTIERLATVADRLQEWGLPARWVHPQDYHVTLCFLGDVEPSAVGGIAWSLADVAGSLAMPELGLPGLGAFGGRREPKVVYAAVDDPADWCAMAHRDLQEALGEAPERRFHPHITLCRPRGGGVDAGPRSWRRLLEAFGQALWGRCGVQELVFYQSGHGAGGGPRYRMLERWPLHEPAA